MNAAFKSGILSVTIIAVLLIAMVSGLSAQRKTSFRTGSVGTRALEYCGDGRSRPISTLRSSRLIR
jgi:hypothetical protein